MNIIDIVKNSPEGAERYKVFYGGHHAEYYAIIDGVKSFYNPVDGSWVTDLASYYDSSLPIPKLKTEWVKVEDSIFDPQLQVDFESGVLYTLTTDGAYKELKEDEILWMVNLVAGNLYRKVETVINEKQEFIEKVMSDHFNRTGVTSEIVGEMFDAGCRFVEE